MDPSKKLDELSPAENRRRVKTEKQITAILTQFIQLPPGETDRGIRQALQAIGEFAGVDRSYLFLFSEDGTRADPVYEWQAEGVEAHSAHVRDLPVAAFPWWIEQLQRSGLAHLPLFDPPSQIKQTKSAQTPHQSLLSVSVRSHGNCVGFIGLHALRSKKRWTKDEIRLLKTVGEILASAVERKRLEESRGAALHYMESMHRISKVIEQAADGDEMLRKTMEQAGKIFQADRAWLIYPCDPDAPSWTMPVRYAVPEFLSGIVPGEERPTDPAAAEVFRASLARDEPFIFGPHRSFSENARWYTESSIRSQMTVALRPKLGKPWLFGLHQCAYPRTWTAHDRRLFRDISDKIADALDNFLLYQNLQQSEEKYRSVVENVKEVIFQTDAEGRLRFLNPAWQEITGFPLDASLGTPFWEYVSAPDHRRSEELFRLHIEREKGSVQYETRFRTRSGETRWIEVALRAALDPHGNLTGAFGTLNDITERKHLEEKLLHAHKLEAIGQLTGGVAHEFNNLLTAILGNLELAVESVPEKDPSQLFLTAAHQAAGRAAGLTQQLLSFGRRKPIVPQPQDLGEEAREVVRLLRQTIDRRIGIDIEAPPDLWPVLAGAGQMNQVIMNLCFNARDALQERAAKEGNPETLGIRIHIENVRLRRSDCRGRPDARPGEYVRLSVADNGCGIDEAILHRIFEPFFTTKEVGRGTGLGLAEVDGIIAQHHGWIELVSAKGQGTTFNIYLPRTDRSVAPPALPPAGRDGGGRGTLLFVDDEEPIRRLAQRVLEKEGYKVLLAGDGVEATDLYKSRREEIQLVILDLTMPRQSGQEVFRRLREIDPTLKVIISSGHPTGGNSPPGFSLPEAVFLSKPYRPQDLIQKVRETLQQTVPSPPLQPEMRSSHR